MSSDFEHTLKMLGKQARQAEKARIEAEAAQRRREAEIVDFAAAVGEVGDAQRGLEIMAEVLAWWRARKKPQRAPGRRR